MEILAAKSGEEALAVLSDKNVNLVITDINMPGMNGLDLLIEINNRYPQTGVIIMTAYPSNAYKNEAMLRGSLRFIEKPFDINDMRRTVQQVLKENEGFQGTVDGIELMDIVQFNGLSRATAALKVTTTDHEGMIFFKNGEVVHAMCDNESGENAPFSPSSAFTAEPSRTSEVWSLPSSASPKTLSPCSLKSPSNPTRKRKKKGDDLGP